MVLIASQRSAAAIPDPKQRQFAHYRRRAVCTRREPGNNADQHIKLLDVLDEMDDVQNVYDNLELSKEEMARLAGWLGG